MNLRFYSKMKCVTCGICLFDCLNYLFCYCFLRKPCLDRWNNPWTAGKWIFKAAFIGYTISLIRNRKDEWEETFEAGGEVGIDPANTSLDAYLIVYMLQHPIFLLSRPILFVLYSLVTCCCDRGVEIEDERLDEVMRNKIVAYGFIEYELGQVNNFENHPVGREEI